MELALSASEIISGAVGGAVSTMLVAEFDAWSPVVSRVLARFAARMTPTLLRERFTEEWLGRVEDAPGKVGKLFLAAGLCVAGARIGGGFALRGAGSVALQMTVSVLALFFILPIYPTVWLGPIHIQDSP